MVSPQFTETLRLVLPLISGLENTPMGVERRSAQQARANDRPSGQRASALPAARVAGISPPNLD
jgi:hypothetical protein